MNWNSTAWILIGNVETISACLDNNPVFHDSEIRTIVLDRAKPSIEITLNVNTPGKAEREIRLRFVDPEEVTLQDFNHQNVITSLCLTRVMKTTTASELPQPRIRVEVESVFGAAFSFDCEGGTVISADAVAS